MVRTYSELIKIPTFLERFKCLKLNGSVGVDTFGFDRYLNQTFYRSYEWKRLRNDVIVRDMGCDLGLEGYDIFDKILVHHMNPISLEDIEDKNPELFNPEYLICVSHDTHNAIHYGDEHLIIKTELKERRPNDTCPWKE